MPILRASKVKDLARQMASGLRALHAVDTIHADLGFKNICLSKGKVTGLSFGGLWPASEIKPLNPFEQLSVFGRTTFTRALS